MLSFLFLAALVSLAAAQTKPVAVCNASQCLKGTTNITNFGATLLTSDTDFILLPGTYTPSVSDSDLQKALTSSSSTVSIGVGFANNTAANNTAPTAPGPPSLPLTLSLQPGVLSFPTDGFIGVPTFISQPTSPNSFNGTALTRSSLLVSPNTWAAIEATTGSSTSRVVIWDNFPFWSQLPPSLAIASSISVTNIQPSTCSPACSSKAVCSTQGKCVCPTGFTGTSCETCEKGFFGPNCSKCPDNCDKCDEGPSGTGACLSTPIPSSAPSKCNCLNGSCSSSGSCTCLPGWANASNGTACATCAAGFVLDSSTGNCVSCGTACDACTATACTTCSPGTVLNPSDPKSCLTTTCRVGEYRSGDACVPCNPLCATCTGPSATNCASCPSTAALRGTQCLTLDGAGKCQGTDLVSNRSTNVCDTCPPKCAKCSIPNFDPKAVTQDQRQCDQCLPGFAVDNGKCVETCPDGKVVSSDGTTCTACTNGCATCVGSASFCRTCSSGQFAFNGQCVASCPTNTLSSIGTCIPCHPDCATCSGPSFDQCKSCPPSSPVLASSGRCLPTCSRTEYFDASSGTCKPCDSSCGSCSAGGPSGCLSCASDKAVLRVGKCEAVDCGSGSGTVNGLGVCLAELVVVPNKAAIPPVSIPPLDPNAPSRAQEESGGFKPEWWQILLMVLGGLFIIGICVLIWRRQARKKRAKRTQQFKAKLDNRGFWSKLWSNPFGIFKRKKRDHRARDLEGARSSAGDWRTSASRTDEDRRTWITTQEPIPRRPSLTGRSRALDSYTYDSRTERSEGRSQRMKNQPPYLGVPARSQYGEFQYGKEIEDDDYRTERSYSYRAPTSQRDREPTRQPSYVREQEQHYADLIDYRASRGGSPSLYSQVTGQTRQRPEPKGYTRDLLTSRFGETTDGDSSIAPKVLRKPPLQSIPDSDMPWLEDEEPPEPRQRSEAEIYKLNNISPEPRDQPRDYSSSGTTAVDRNPFRKPSY